MTRHLTLVLSLCAVLFSPLSRAVVLFDGSLGTLPGVQGWTYGTDPLSGASATQVAAGGVTTLDSTPVQSEAAGYFSKVPPFTAHPNVGVLDRSAGFVLRFDARILEENHSSSDRAGFSVIVVTSDLAAIELGFWEDRVWAQDDSPLFTHAEESLFNTTAGLTQFELTIYNSGYSLAANGIGLLDGALRDYTSFTGTPNVYEIPNFIFFGDDTSSADARTELAYISLEDVVVPVPAAVWLFGSGCLVLFSAGRRGRRTR